MSKVEGIKASELEDLQFAFETYECDKGKLDSTQLGNVMRAMKLNPSLQRLTDNGVVDKEGAKIMNFDEVTVAYAALKKEVKDMGCYEDFIECLKLYDKNENGRMLTGELSHSLLSLGEKLTDVQVDELFEDCLPEENDEGEIEYVPFLAAMCEVKKA